MIKIIKLTESQLDDILNDPLLDEGEDFSFETLKNMDWKDYRELDVYCQRCGLQQIGSGAGRIVYALDDRLVLKIGKGNYEQNDAEVFAYRKMSEDLREFVPMIFDYDKQHMRPMWIISERVLPASYADFKKILGIDFGNYQSSQDIKDMNNDLETYKKYPSKQTDESINLSEFLDAYADGDISLFSNEIKHNRWLNTLVKMLNQGFVSYMELWVIENWGLVYRNGKPCIIILDTGM